MLPSRIVVIAAVLCSLTACGSSSSSPTGPTSATGPLSGAWTGTLARFGATQTLRLDLTDTGVGTGSAVSGTYTITDNGGTSRGSAGGVAVNGTVSLTLKPAAPPTCPSGPPLPVPAGDMLLTLTLTGQQMSGQAVIVQCASQDVGTVTLSR